MQCRTPGRGLWIVVLSLTLLCTRAFADQATLVADAHVNSALPAVNSGAISNINVGGGYTGLLQFDLGMLPAGTTSAQVSRAVLRLYVNRVDAGGAISLQALNAAWSEYGVTYSTLPGVGTAAQTFNVAQAGAYVAVDVTALVKGWISAPATNFGVALTASTAIAQFDSKENDLTGHAAALDIEFTTQGAAGPAGPAGPQGVAGPQGAQGVAGPQGAQGLQGPQGIAGAAGPSGPAGTVGPAGPKGSTGFTYQGNYDPTVTYALADVVLSGGSSYLSLGAGNRGNSPASSPLTWGLLASGGSGGTGGGSGGVAYQGVYSSATNYGLNDIVLYGASSYISLVAGNHGNTPASGSAYWGLLAVGGSGVVGPAGPAGPQGPQGQQGAPGLGFEGAYVSGTNYGLNDVVSFGGSSYISLTAGNHGNTPGQSPQSWAVLAAAGVGTAGATGATGATGPQGASGPQGPQGVAGAQGIPGVAGAAGLPGLVYQGAYSSSTNYALGDVVLWQGASWSSLVASNHGNAPSLSPTYWGMLTAQGPAGTAGATGAAGPAGPTGPLGPVGPPGQTGAQGLQGIAGQAGAQGLTGLKGDAGLSGPMGPQGQQGPVGLAFKGTYSSSTNYALADGVMYGGAGYVSIIASNHGNTPDQSPGAWSLFAAAGSAGAAGPQGPVGLSGIAGPAGPQGPTGASGAQGAVGPQGPAVANFVGYYSSTTNYGVADAVSYKGSTYVSLTAGNHGNTPDASPTYWAILVAEGQSGVQGPAGPAGAPGVVGPQGPAGATGAQGPPVTFAGGWLASHTYALGDAVSYGGSSYIALNGNAGRQPDLSPNYWGMLAAVGSAGPAGATGATGLQGPTGYPGPAGATGATGVAGPIGPMGPAGTTGPAGPTGAAGPQGVAGARGLTYRGAYDSTVSYAANDGVTFGGSTYISLAGGNAGNTPTSSPTLWGPLAAQGAAGSAGAAGINGKDGATGAQGPAGPVGPQGATGAAGANGTAGLVFQGAYSSATNYALNDAVTYGGGSWISLVPSNHGNAPDLSPTYWAALAKAGATGAAGPAGPSGAAGATGPQGPLGAQGATGATGAAGINFRGAWVAGTGYAANDAVTLGGTTYLAQMSNGSVRPDANPGVWAVLAASGVAGPTGAAGAAATVQVGTVTTGAAGTSASVTNSGTASAAVLNFVIPQGVAGAGGSGGTGGVPAVAMYHAVSYAATYYSVGNTNQSASETAAVLTWVPAGCSATRLDVFSQQGATITVTLRVGTPGTMADSALSCQVSTGKSCSAAGSVAVPAGGFIDIGITHPDSNPVGVWMAVTCN